MKLTITVYHVKENIFSAHVVPFDNNGEMLRSMNSLFRVKKWSIEFENERIEGYLSAREDMLFCAGKNNVSFDTVENRKKLQEIVGKREKAIFESENDGFLFRAETY